MVPLASEKSKSHPFQRRPFCAPQVSTTECGGEESTECLSWERTWPQSGFKPPSPSFPGAPGVPLPSSGSALPAHPQPCRGSCQTALRTYRQQQELQAPVCPHLRWGRNKRFNNRGSISRNLRALGKLGFSFPFGGGSV